MVAEAHQIVAEVLGWQLRLHGHVEVFDQEGANVLLRVPLLIEGFILEVVVDKINRTKPCNHNSQQIPELQNAKEYNLPGLLVGIVASRVGG